MGEYFSQVMPRNGREVEVDFKGSTFKSSPVERLFSLMKMIKIRLCPMKT